MSNEQYMEKELRELIARLKRDLKKNKESLAKMISEECPEAQMEIQSRKEKILMGGEQ